MGAISSNASGSEGETQFNYLELALEMADENAYILSILTKNVIVDDTVKNLQERFGNDTTGIMHLLDVISVVLKKDEKKAREISDYVHNFTGRFVGCFEYSTKLPITELYSIVVESAQLAETNKQNHRTYDTRKDSLEGKLGIE